MEAQVKKLKLIKIAVIAGAIFIPVLAASYFFWQYMGLKNNPDIVAKETTKKLVASVGNLYALPSGEEPTVAKIKDKSKLGDQEFFKSAENDDYILIYTNAKLALIYREKDNKLINVGPISISSDAASKDKTKN